MCDMSSKCHLKRVPYHWLIRTILANLQEVVKMIKLSVLSQRFFEKLWHRIQHPAWRENSWAPLYFQAVGLNSLFNLCSKSLICCLSAMEGQWYCSCLSFWYLRFVIWGLPIKKQKGSKAKHLLGMSLKVEMSNWSKKVRSNRKPRLLDFDLIEIIKCKPKHNVQ